MVLALLVGAAVGSSRELAFLYAGTILQLLGVFLVAYGLSEVRRSFGRRSFLAEVRAWCMAWAGVFRNPKNQVASAVGIAVGLSGVSATGSAGSVAVATLEGRVGGIGEVTGPTAGGNARVRRSAFWTARQVDGRVCVREADPSGGGSTSGGALRGLRSRGTSFGDDRRSVAAFRNALFQCPKCRRRLDPPRLVGSPTASASRPWRFTS